MKSKLKAYEYKLTPKPDITASSYRHLLIVMGRECKPLEYGQEEEFMGELSIWEWEEVSKGSWRRGRSQGRDEGGQSQGVNQTEP